MAAAEIYVLDACAVVALMQREPGAEIVTEILKSDKRCLIHVINACEVYYDLYRRTGPEDASALPDLLAASGIELIETISGDLWQTAGKLKAKWRRVSLADCFALALAGQEDGILLTSDHHELDRLAEAGVCQIEFIR